MIKGKDYENSGNQSMARSKYAEAYRKALEVENDIQLKAGINPYAKFRGKDICNRYSK